MTYALPSAATGSLHAMQHDGTPHDDGPHDDGPRDGDAADAAPTTGHPAVDAVLASLADLESRPVSEHVGVFERAHESLRSALDAPLADATAGAPVELPAETAAEAEPGEPPSGSGRS